MHGHLDVKFENEPFEMSMSRDICDRNVASVNKSVVLCCSKIFALPSRQPHRQICWAVQSQHLLCGTFTVTAPLPGLSCKFLIFKSTVLKLLQSSSYSPYRLI